MVNFFKCSIVRPDKYIRLNDDECFVDHELTWLPKDIHAIHWFGQEGEIEYKNKYPEKIYSFNQYYQYVVDEINEYKLLLQKQEEEYKKNNYNPELIVRIHRNNLLSQSDWSQITDVPLTEEQKEMWRLYRQELRELPNKISDFDLYATDFTVWPTPPQ